MTEAFELFLWGPGAHRVVQAFSGRRPPPGVQVRAGALGAVLHISHSVPDEWMAALARQLDNAHREGALGFGVTPERDLDADALLREWAYSRRMDSQTREATPGPGGRTAGGLGLNGGDSGWFLAELVVELAKAVL